jgi:apolipoprotein N-acyltransferase
VTLGAELVSASPGQGFLLGYLSGIIWYAGTCHWVYYVMHVYGGIDAALSVGILILFCLYLALYHGLFGLLMAVAAGRKMSTGMRALLIAPFLWVGVELARSRISGFPWDLLGTVQVDNIPLARIATITGVYGLSFEIMLVNAAFAAAFLVRRERRRTMLFAAIAAGVVLQTTRWVVPPPRPADHVAVLVQENVPILDASQWTPQYFDSTMRDLGEISLQARQEQPASQSPGLIVWPESPAPFYVNDPNFRSAISEIARRGNAYVITGSIGTQNAVITGQPNQIYNSAALIAPTGVWAARYDKIHLVPFGEYVPFKQFLFFAEKLTREVGEFGRGVSRQPFDVGAYRIGTFICYESVFPDEVRQFAHNGANLFVNISNDEWYGNTGAFGQHLLQARMRAVENGRWLLRSTNTGVTASIDPDGRIVAHSPRNVRTALQAPFALVTDTTFYTRHGDWFAYACAIISIVALIVRLRFRVGTVQ